LRLRIISVHRRYLTPTPLEAFRLGRRNLERLSDVSPGDRYIVWYA
jgi:hypothetical protein